MKVFASNYLESMSSDSVSPDEKWSWTPAGEIAIGIYACGAPTSTHQSTYAAETDNRSDTDRPNEGMYVA